MSYQVLARKWRPRDFEQLVGQEHVVRALVNALESERLHHAYLFTGTRGVGKTTVARILAKALNCDQGVTAKPCGACESCRAIDENRFVDLIEVDAASRTKVEETRELLENVQYTPTRGRFKVYLIDEVHMFSGHSFNALLKTLEEPPPHVKFLLATTDPQRLPVTILSRCLQFNLRRMSAELIDEQLTRILTEEGVEAEDAARVLLARAADGSMRDALSLLDQAIAYGGGAVREADVRSMLGSVERGRVHRLARALAAGDGAALLAEVAEAAQGTADLEALLTALVSLLQRVAVAQVVPAAADTGDVDAAEAGVIAELAAALPAEDVQLYYQIGVMGRRDLPLAPDPRAGLEMVLLRMLAFRPGAAGAGETAPAPARETPGAAPPAEARPQAAPAPQPAPSATAAPADGAWAETIAAMGLKGILRELAANCAFLERDGDRVRLALDPAHAQLRSDNLEKRLQTALSKHYGAKVKLSIETAPEANADAAETPAQARERAQRERRAAAVTAIEEDANVKAMEEAFNAKVRTEGIQPLEE